jgi:hypothetical protein
VIAAKAAVSESLLHYQTLHSEYQRRDLEAISHLSTRAKKAEPLLAETQCIIDNYQSSIERLQLKLEKNNTTISTLQAAIAASAREVGYGYDSFFEHTQIATLRAINANTVPVLEDNKRRLQETRDSELMLIEAIQMAAAPTTVQQDSWRALPDALALKARVAAAEHVYNRALLAFQNVTSKCGQKAMITSG